MRRVAAAGAKSRRLVCTRAAHALRLENAGESLADASLKGAAFRQPKRHPRLRMPLKTRWGGWNPYGRLWRGPDRLTLDVKLSTEYNQVRDQVVPLRRNRATSPSAAEPPLSGYRAHRQAKASAIGQRHRIARLGCSARQSLGTI